MLASAAALRSSRQKKERKVTAIFRPISDTLHAAALTALAVDHNQGRVFTASRDFTVKRWNCLENGRPAGSVTFNGHTDWVNDVVLLGPNTVATASTDRSIRLWTSDGAPTYQFLEHEDDVTCLAAAPQHALLASGGLGGQAMLWDVEAGTKMHQAYEPWQAPGLKHSVYSIALSADGSLMATGSPETSIRLTDSRAKAKLFKLTGHTANVRALRLNAAGTMCVSASSDHTLRLWDLGQQRCVGVYAVHNDAAWTVAVDEPFSRVVSGGRDGCVYKTDLVTHESALLCNGLGPVRQLALSNGGTCVWTASEGMGLASWPAPPLPLVLRTRAPSLSPHKHTDADAGTPCTAEGSAPATPSTAMSRHAPLPAGVTPLESPPSGPAVSPASGSIPIHRLPSPGGAQSVANVRPTTSADSQISKRAAAYGERANCRPSQDPGVVSVHSQPVAFVAPMSPAQRNRQLTESSDLSTPLLARPLFAVAMQSTLTDAAVLNDQRQVLTRDRSGAASVWDVTTGAVTELRPRTKSLADDLATLWLPAVVAPWFTVKIVSGLLAVTLDPMAGSLAAAEMYATDLGFNDQGNARLRYAEHFIKGLFCIWASRAPHMDLPDSLPLQQDSRQPGCGRAPFAFYTGPEPPPLVVFEAANGKQCRRLVTEAEGLGFTGYEEEGEMIPHWVVQCLNDGTLPGPSAAEIAFKLAPVEGSGLPKLPADSLHAPAILKLDKVAEHVCSLLQKQNVQGIQPAVASANKQQPQQSPSAEASILQLTCHGQVLPLDLTLAATAKFLDKGGMLIEYGISDPLNPLPAAIVRPPRSRTT